MKKEAMIKVLRYKAEHIKTKIRPEFFAEVADVLEQEPCEDCISRADAIRVASGYCHTANIAKELAKLPPVTPEPRYTEEELRVFQHGISLSCCQSGRLSIGIMMKTRLQKLSSLNGFTRMLARI